MKDETASVAIEELVGLKPKMYSYLVDDNSEHKKTKGVTVILITIKKSFLPINCFNFFSSQNSFFCQPNCFNFFSS